MQSGAGDRDGGSALSPLPPIGGNLAFVTISDQKASSTARGAVTFLSTRTGLFNGSEVKTDCMHAHAVKHACPPPLARRTGNRAERGEPRGASFPGKDLANVCSGSLRVGEEASMLCIFETFQEGQVGNKT